MVALRKPEDIVRSHPEMELVVPEAWRVLSQAQDAIRRHKIESALRSLDTILKSRPNDPFAATLKGTVLAEIGELERALASFESALSGDPNFVDAQFNKAITLCRLGRAREAISSLDDALAVGPDEALLSLRRALVKDSLMKLARRGLVSWSGSKPLGAKPRVRLDLDRPLSDYVIENRR